MKHIQPIYTKEEWNKVRLLANKWYRQIEWHIPTKGYYGLLIIGIIGTVASHEYRLWFVILTAIAGAQLYAREKQIQGYVEGWQQGQEYITGDYTIDELLDIDKSDKTKP